MTEFIELNDKDLVSVLGGKKKKKGGINWWCIGGTVGSAVAGGAMGGGVDPIGYLGGAAAGFAASCR